MLGRSATRKTKKENQYFSPVVCIVNDIYRGKGQASVFMNNYPGGSLRFLRRNG